MLGVDAKFKHWTAAIDSSGALVPFCLFICTVQYVNTAMPRTVYGVTGISRVPWNEEVVRSCPVIIRTYCTSAHTVLRHYQCIGPDDHCPRWETTSASRGTGRLSAGIITEPLFGNHPSPWCTTVHNRLEGSARCLAIFSVLTN